MTLPMDLAHQAEILREELCARWQRNERLPAEVLLRRHPTLLADPNLALQLVYQEILLRERHGEAPQLAEYLHRFPQFAERLPPLFAVHRVLESERPLDISCTDTALDLNVDTGTVELPAIPGYEVLEVVGRGGMGVVYKAHQTALNRLVALKMVAGGAQANPRDRARFRAEAEAQARLQHANIVPVYEVGEWRGRPYLVMEYVDGGSLQQLIGSKPQPAPAAAALVETLAQAMNLAHQQGLVHRDLKPANILLTTGGTPKIADFGLAKLLQGEAGNTLPGDVLGTPCYMAPEQAEGRIHEVGPAADVYALGTILYELLAGRPPFVGRSPLETLTQVRTQEPAPLGRLRRGVPRDLEAICFKCLRKEPERRYPSAAGLADDLTRFRKGLPVAARRTTWLERLWLWCRRQPAAAVVTFALLFLAASGTVSLLTGVLLTLSAGYIAVLSLWLRAEQQREQAEDGYVRAEADLGRARQRQADAEMDVLEAQHYQAQAEARLRRAEEQQRRAQQALRETNAVVGRQVALLQNELAQSYLQMGNVYCQAGKYAEAVAAYRQVLAIRERQGGGGATDARSRSFLAVTWNNLGEALRQLGQRAEARHACLEAVEQQRRAAAAVPDDPSYGVVLSRHCGNLARVNRELGRLQEAVAACQEGVQSCAGEPAQLRLLAEEMARCAAANPAEPTWAEQVRVILEKLC